MSPKPDILLQLWREASQHTQIEEFAEFVLPLLQPYLDVLQLTVLRIDVTQKTLSQVCEVPLSRSLDTPVKVTLTKPQLKQWQALSSSMDVWVVTNDDQTDGPTEHFWQSLIPATIHNRCLIGRLAAPHQMQGLLVISLNQETTPTTAQIELMQLLLEPFSIALENDQRLHEINALREAAEADRRSLLTRLGRREITEEIVGAKSGLASVMERIERVTSSDVPVLILGETGTGKEVISRAIHTRSNRRTGPFIRVNCGAIPHELIDSQLFGHEKGSFTGAIETRQGWFERADQGTLFLDEIGELPPAAQVRLLRVLQDGHYERVGGQHPIRVDVRIVAATHRDLPTMVSRREFREDLWYRLAVFPIVLPPLRERVEDIRQLACYFAERAATRFGLPVIMPTESDFILLTGYTWPGNIRELGTVIDRAAILGDGKSLEIATALGSQHRTQVIAQPVHVQSQMVSASSTSFLSLDQAMQQHIEAALKLTRGKVEGAKGAAKLLAINPHTLRARMRKLGIEWERFRE
jgi:transcriptional regulator with GAF, ATPase, and Fis domain